MNAVLDEPKTELKLSEYPHVRFDKDGGAVVGALNFPVRFLIGQMLGSDKMSPERIQEGFPTLSMAEIHTAIAYYHDHRAEIEMEIAQEAIEIEELKKLTYNVPLQEKLAAIKRDRKASVAATGPTT